MESFPTVEVNAIIGSHTPAYSSEDAAGLDLKAHIEAPIVLGAGERLLVSSGLSVAIPKGFVGFVTPRSGLALKHGITVLNAPGTIDADYRSVIGVILYNTSSVDFVINPGDRIAQLVVQPCVQLSLNAVVSLDTTTRGVGGFGSTGA